MELKIMTYNIMSGRDYDKMKQGMGWLDPEVINPSLVAEVIKENGADIVGMNEVHNAGGAFDDQTKRIAKEAGYEYCYFAKAIMDGESPYGNAILSKYPIIEVETIGLAAGDKNEDKRCEARSIVNATIDVEGKKIKVLISHFGLLESEKDTAMKAIKELINNSQYPCILMGDFNMEPNEDRILELKSILKDTAPDEIDENWYTFSSDEPHTKIDYILVDKNIEVKSACPIDAEPSDHKPYVAEIVL